MAKKKRDVAVAQPAEAAPPPLPSFIEKEKAPEPEREPEPEQVAAPVIEEDVSAYDGARMKKARELKGLSLKEISEKTKISVGTLSALEEERYEDMPSARVYVRGFIRCFAEEIGLDKDQVAQGYVPRWERWFNENSRRY